MQRITLAPSPKPCLIPVALLRKLRSGRAAYGRARSWASYALLNFRIGYDIGQKWSGYLEARNLFDRRYISSVAIAGVANLSLEIFNAGTGRAVYGGLRHRW
nr:TonB-dependent receptor [Methylorubrum rhodesianum]